jgi:hypothetical protein
VDTRTLRCEDRSVSKIEVLDSRHLRLTSPGRHDVQPEQESEVDRTETGRKDQLQQVNALGQAV